MGSGESENYLGAYGSAGKPGCGGRIEASAFFEGLLETHYKDHCNEFDEPLSKCEYEQRARDFFDKPITKYLDWFENDEGTLYKYDYSKNEFGMCLSSGIMVTYFRPDDSYLYWKDMRRKHEKEMLLMLRH
jgi:hypothetical protein